jgi:hypothetical protein
MIPAIAALGDVATPGDVFDPGALLRAVSMLHELGEPEAGRALQRYGAEADLGPRREGGQLEGLPAILGARLLYLPRDASANISPPALGKPDIGLNRDEALAPYWPLVISCEVPFLPVGAFILGGAPSSVERYVAQARESGRLRERPLEPTCAPVEAADGLTASPEWPRLIPDPQSAYARSLIRRQALRASRPELPVDDEAIASLVAASPAELDGVWGRLTDSDVARALQWDPAMRRFRAP